MKKIHLFLWIIFPSFLFSQITLKVLDENAQPVSGAKIGYNNHSYTTDNQGVSKIPLATTEETLIAEKEGFKAFSKKINTSYKVQHINILLVSASKETTIQEVVFQKQVLIF